MVKVGSVCETATCIPTCGNSLQIGQSLRRYIDKAQLFRTVSAYAIVLHFLFALFLHYHFVLSIEDVGWLSVDFV